MKIDNLLLKVEKDFDRFEIDSEAKKKFMPLLAKLGEFDKPTLEHSDRVAYLGAAIAEFTHLVTQRTLWLPGLVHDIGKINTPLEILSKTTGFSRSDEEKMREHVEEGCRILLEIADFSAFVVFYHHYFKTDYPYPSEEDFPRIFGNRFDNFGEATKLLAKYCGRLLSIADIYDATKTRPNDKYSPGKPRLLTSEQAKQRLLEEGRDQEHLINELYNAGIFE